MNFFCKNKKSMCLLLMILTITSLPGFARVGVGPAGATFDANLKILRSKGIIGTHEVQLEVVGSGIVKTNQQKGRKVELLAIPDSGYYFSHWEGAITGNENPTTVTYIQNDITAVFAPIPTEPLHLVYTDEAERGVFVRNIEGSEVRQLGQLAEGYRVRGLLSSPDGTKIALYRYRSSDGDFSFFVADPETFENIYEFNESYDDDPRAWSSDGMKLAYTAKEQLRVYDFSKEETIEFNIEIPKGYLSWAPDNKRIVFVDNQGNLYIADVETQILTKLLEHKGDTYYGTPAWSPVSNLIAYSKTSSEEGDSVTHIFVMDANTKITKQLTKSSESNSSPLWSPDGSRIAYMHGMSIFSKDLYIMNADGSNPKRVNSDFIFGTHKWSKYGARILCSEGLGKYKIVNLDGTIVDEVESSIVNWFE